MTMTNVVLAPMARVSMTLGDLAGTTPSSGTARYYATDHLGSTRSAWDASKASVGTYEFTPYGQEYNHTGAALDSLAGAFTGKPWDDSAQLFHFPYRQYSPDMARWTTRDPLGMVDGPNVYGYVMGSPLAKVDKLGQKSGDGVCDPWALAFHCANAARSVLMGIFACAACLATMIIPDPIPGMDEIIACGACALSIIGGCFSTNKCMDEFQDCIGS